MFLVPVALKLNICFLSSDTGYPKGPVEAARSENDDGSDFCSVQLYLQDPHPVPPQLQAHLSVSVCVARPTWSSQKV